jgi:hypothetical protein
MPPGADLIAAGGTAGLILALGLAAWTLYRRLEKEQTDAIGRLTARIAEIRGERDEAIVGWREQTEATERTSQALLRLTAAIETRNEIELERERSRRRR